MGDRIRYVGLDVHKDGIVVAEGGLRGEVRDFGRIVNTPAALQRLVRKLGPQGVELRLRGLALVNAATLIAELGDLSRFDNPRQLMAYRPISGWCHPSIRAGRASNAAASPRPATARPAGC